MQVICDSNKCTGCGSCYNICPTSAINMKDSNYTGLHPMIDRDKCIECNKCKKVCHVLQDEDKHFPQQVYAAWVKDDNARGRSSSGGIATCLAEKVLIEQGYVCGATIDEGIKVKHILVQNLKDLESLRGSKYVESNTEKTYITIKEKLTEDKKVLFIGTPCQVQGLKCFLGKEFENLYTVDLICHGAPPYSILDKCISVYKKNEIKTIKFRHNNNFELSIFTNLKGKIVDQSGYITGFINGLFYRENCYKCKYAEAKRVGDITLGDFWGIDEQETFNYTTEKGVSLVLINTQKGKELFAQSDNNIIAIERTLDEAIKGNEQLSHPSIMHKKRYVFMKIINTNSFEMACSKCLKKEYLKRNISRIVYSNKMLKGIWTMIKK